MRARRAGSLRQQLLFGLVETGLPVIGRRLALVGEPFPLVGDPIAFVGDPVALVSHTLTLRDRALKRLKPFQVLAARVLVL